MKALVICTKIAKALVKKKIHKNSKNTQNLDRREESIFAGTYDSNLNGKVDPLY